MKQLIIAAFALPIVTGAAFAHGNKEHRDSDSEPPEMVETEFGKTGDQTKVTRVITFTMNDELRFFPDTLQVKVGETVKFIVRNDGEALHEMVLGRAGDLAKHAKLMQEFPDMEHEEPFMAHVQPGQQGQIVWMFSRAGEFEFGCLIPGHYEGGMKGTIVVQ